jgi:hypothetical protein
VKRAGEVRARCNQFAFSVKLEEIEKLDDSISSEGCGNDMKKLHAIKLRSILEARYH